MPKNETTDETTDKTKTEFRLLRFSQGIWPYLWVGAVVILSWGCSHGTRSEEVSPTPEPPSASVEEVESLEPAPKKEDAPKKRKTKAEKLLPDSSEEERAQEKPFVEGRRDRTSLDEIVVECGVKLPDDPTDNIELCRSFRMVVLDQEGNEIQRFRFRNDGLYRFRSEPKKEYRIQSFVGKNWELVISPNRPLRTGDRVRIEFKQKSTP